MIIQRYPSLSWPEFYASSQEFLRQSEHVGDHWHWIEQNHGANRDGFLEKKLVIPVKHDWEKLDVYADPNVVEEEDMVSFRGDALETLTVTYHILYSSSYQVPVLYFNAYFSNGTPLTLSQIYTYLIPAEYHTPLQQLRFGSGVTQSDHPYFRTPFYYVHPCETQTLLSSISGMPMERNGHRDSGVNDTGKYMRSWLSLVGPAVGCKICVEYFVNKDAETKES
ncbi:uncharacterized protein VTP21DRAFT_2084 [Calcarisporiella thermophila]|uniref:uncharacterized protein n=1 Tax=Calcarisporiella thermophila TaxID=911321 RepID=UPI003742EFF3